MNKLNKFINYLKKEYDVNNKYYIMHKFIIKKEEVQLWLFSEDLFEINKFWYDENKSFEEITRKVEYIDFLSEDLYKIIDTLQEYSNKIDFWKKSKK